VTRAQDWLAVAAALAVVLFSLVFAARALDVGSQPRSLTSGAPAPASPSAAGGTFESPLTRNPRTLLLAEHSRDVLIGLAAVPGGPVDLLPAPSVGGPPSPSALRVRVGSRPVGVSSCGPGCFRLPARVLAGAPRTVSIEVVRPGKPAARASFRLPSRLPPSGQRLFRAVARTMDGLRTLVVRETLTDGLGGGVRTRYEWRAPDRQRILSSSGPPIVVIGNRGWQLDGRRWVRRAVLGQLVPTYPWQGGTHARLLGWARLGRVRVRVLALYRAPLPLFGAQSPVWFRLFVAPGGRVLEMEALTRAYFVTDRFGAFDAPLEIEPPA
jgi:hypothetical protein